MAVRGVRDVKVSDLVILIKPTALLTYYIVGNLGQKLEFVSEITDRSEVLRIIFAMCCWLMTFEMLSYIASKWFLNEGSSSSLSSLFLLIHRAAMIGVRRSIDGSCFRISILSWYDGSVLADSDYWEAYWVVGKDRWYRLCVYAIGDERFWLQSFVVADDWKPDDSCAAIDWILAAAEWKLIKEIETVDRWGMQRGIETALVLLLHQESGMLL